MSNYSATEWMWLARYLGLADCVFLPDPLDLRIADYLKDFYGDQ